MASRTSLTALWCVTTGVAFGLGWMLQERHQAPADAAAMVMERTFPEPARVTPLQRPPKQSDVPLDVGDEAVLADNLALSPEQMHDAMMAMAKENDPVRQADLFAKILASLTPENAKTAVLALRDSPGKNRDQVRVLLRAWGQMDGAGAIEAMSGVAGEMFADSGVKKGKSRDNEIFQVIAGWASADSAAAAEFVASVELQDGRALYTQAMVDGLLVKGVNRALEYVQGLPADDPQRRRYVASIAKEVLEQGSERALDWADQLPEDLRHDAYAGIMSSLAIEAPEEAMAMIDDFPRETQKNIVSRALDQWTKRDPLGASEYLAQMTDSPVKDQAVGKFATELAREDPEAAAAWATTIGSDKVRQKALSQVTRSWLKADRAAAEVWLESNPVPVDASKGKRNGKPIKVRRQKERRS